MSTIRTIELLMLCQLEPDQEHDTYALCTDGTYGELAELADEAQNNRDWAITVLPYYQHEIMLPIGLVLVSIKFDSKDITAKARVRSYLSRALETSLKLGLCASGMILTIGKDLDSTYPGPATIKDILNNSSLWNS